MSPVVHTLRRLSGGRLGVRRRTASRFCGICARGDYAENGCLLSYGPSYSIEGRDGARFVDKIIKGARPADLPVEQPTKFELVINLNTAKRIGVTIPPSVLNLADKVIQ